MCFRCAPRKLICSDVIHCLLRGLPCSWYQSICPCAGLPFVVINTLCGALAAYGFAGLRYTPAAVVLFGIILLMQSLIAIQILVFCVYVSSDQVSACYGAATMMLCVSRFSPAKQSVFSPCWHNVSAC